MALELREDTTPHGKPERLTVDTPVNLHPAWMPEGSEIVYTGGTGWSVNQPLVRLPLSRQPDPCLWQSQGRPAISRQGNRLAYAVGRQDSNIWRVEVPGRVQSPGRP